MICQDQNVAILVTRMLVAEAAAVERKIGFGVRRGERVLPISMRDALSWSFQLGASTAPEDGLDHEAGSISSLTKHRSGVKCLDH